ncbi:hypothetical protein IF125_11550 [Empedobacter stercoris]|uniref:hypothetical protein n=1 Tax=Empedobacter stercoris TaxID=1628248 RepID=UPI001CE04F90|nr:hypothetical protein [Empedobacter stercoris]MCA4782880.1 hypothetical protein [Empedobacter stercoris]
MNKGVIGLYGCYCHPFKDWVEHNEFHKQIIKPGERYRIRHTEEECIVEGFSSDGSGYVKVFVEPFDCERCHQIEHKSNLIPLIDYQLKLF